MSVSYEKDYLKDIYELNTDPCPDFTHLKNTNAPSKLFKMLAEQRNKPKYSDITFMVQKKPYTVHKIVVSLVS